MREKIMEEGELVKELGRLKALGKKIVFTNGCFDLLHVGHIRYLEAAKSFGDILVVAINSDRSVVQLKGPSRPINPTEERAEVLSALASVDYVTVFDEPDPYRIISTLKPHVLVKGGDWTKETTVGRDLVEGQGGEVAIVPYTEGASTTGLIGRILKKSRSTPKKDSPGQ